MENAHQSYTFGHLFFYEIYRPMIDILLNHKTIRKYKNSEIAPDLLNKILEAGTRASTTGNMQLYSVIVSKTKEMKEKLLSCHFNQKMITEAPVVLTFCADFNRFNQWCKLSEAKPGYNNFQSFTAAAIDAVLVAQNVAIAAEANGLGICYLGTTTYLADKIIDVLELPKGVVPVTTLTLGYPNENLPQAERLPLEAVIHNEKYETYTNERIKDLYFEKENMEANKKFVSENNKKTLAQVFTEVRYTKENNEVFSRIFLDVIKKQGFLD